MKGVIYARYSEGPRQTDQSIEGQVADCRAYAEQKGIDVVGIYADRHISGTSTAGRDEFLRMIHDAERQAFDCVIVWKIDRFGRSREDIAVNKMKLRKAGVALMYAREAVPEGPEGILLESLLEGLAEYYSEDLRQKVSRGQREGAKKGRLSAGSTPIGYRRAKDGTVEAVPEEAAAIREAFDLYIAGEKLVDIREKLGARIGKRITPGTLYRILRNDHYLGAYEIQGVTVPVPPIIDRETFDAAQAAHKGSRQNAAGRARVKYLLSCKCHCELCGTMLHGVSGRGKLGKNYHYYKCPKKGCGLKPVPQDVLEDLVLKHTAEDVLGEEMIEKLTGRIMEIQKSQQAEDPATALRKRLAEAKKKQANIIQAIEDGAGSSLVARLNEVDSMIEELTLEIERAELKKPEIPEEIVRGWLQSFRSGDKNDPAFREKLVRTFVADVVVGPEEIHLFYNTTESGPYSVSVRPADWKDRIGARTRTPSIIDGFIVVKIKRPGR